MQKYKILFTPLNENTENYYSFFKETRRVYLNSAVSRSDLIDFENIIQTPVLTRHLFNENNVSEFNTNKILNSLE
jgi:hypothetical protein